MEDEEFVITVKGFSTVSKEHTIFTDTNLWTQDDFWTKGTEVGTTRFLCLWNWPGQKFHCISNRNSTVRDSWREGMCLITETGITTKKPDEESL